MKVNWIKLIILTLALGLGIVSSVQVFAQTTSPTAINSTQDYVNIRHSINTLSQQLFTLYKKNPNCTFSPEYNEEGRLVKMHVSGVSNPLEAQQISKVLMNLEELGTLVQHMNEDFLPVTIEEAENSRLNEQQAEAYVPEFDKPSSEGLITRKTN